MKNLRRRLDPLQVTLLFIFIWRHQLIHLTKRIDFVAVWDNPTFREDLVPLLAAIVLNGRFGVFFLLIVEGKRSCLAA